MNIDQSNIVHSFALGISTPATWGAKDQPDRGPGKPKDGLSPPTVSLRQVRAVREAAKDVLVRWCITAKANLQRELTPHADAGGRRRRELEAGRSAPFGVEDVGALRTKRGAWWHVATAHVVRCNFPCIDCNTPPLKTVDDGQSVVQSLYKPPQVPDLSTVFTVWSNCSTTSGCKHGE